MTDEQLIIECKNGLNIPVESTEFDPILKQKLLAVKGFMIGAGVSAENMTNDLAVGVIVMGVSDLWELKAGEVKFSPLLYTLVNQLAVG